MSEHVAIFGATSGIGSAVAHELARRGDRLCLLARRTDEAEKLAADLKVRHQTDATVLAFDAEAFDEHASLPARLLEALGGRLDGVVISHGVMFDQAEAQADPAKARRTFDVNLTSLATVLEPLAGHLGERGAGWIAVISSVAGDRGRQSNYIYGAAKAGVSAYTAGLRNRLFHRGVAVLTVKPGFVATAMTYGLLDPDSPMVAAPERVARSIVRAIERKRNVIYTPWFWRPILAIIRAIPEAVFKRMKM